MALFHRVFEKIFTTGNCYLFQMFHAKRFFMLHLTDFSICILILKIGSCRSIMKKRCRDLSFSLMYMDVFVRTR